VSKIKYSYSRKANKKPLIAVVTAVIVAAVMLGSAFAWTDFTQSRTNKFRGGKDADVTLHDEFDGENKDVFVENSGDSTIYVRIRLDEFMQVGNHVFKMADPAPTPDVRDKTTWISHTYAGPSIENCGNTDTEDKFHDFYMWKMTGAQRNFLPGTPGMVYGTLGADGKVDENPAGGKPTAAASAPILMSEFLALEILDYNTQMTTAQQAEWDRVKAGLWILDDTDAAAEGGGWAYWSAPLEPGTATNLLLDEVKLFKDAEYDWIYRIDVKLQAVTANDFGKWNDAASECGYKTTAGAEVLISNVFNA